MSQIFPKFDVEPSKMKAKVEGLLEKALEEFEKCLLVETPKWDTMSKFEEIKDELSRYLTEVSHLKNVLNNKSIVLAYDSCIPSLTEFGAYVSQSEDYYNYLNRINREDLNAVQKRLLDKGLEEFKSSGFGLDLEDQERLNDISEQLTKLSQKFMSNVSLARDAWSLNIKDVKKLSGVVDFDLERFKALAHSNGDEGYTLSLATDYITIMTDCDNREIRKAMYLGFNSVATKNCKTGLDNSPVIKKILKLREQKAKLVGYGNYAEYSLRNKMAESPEQVVEFLEDLTAKSKKTYSEDLDEVQGLAIELGINDFKAWDQMYVVKKYQERKYSIDLSSVMEYFPMDKVLKGLYSFVENMFGYSVKEIDVPYKYIDDMMVLELSKKGTAIGYIYCDFYARANKKSGAWMSDYISKEYNSLPIAFVTCNFPKSDPQLLQLNNVTTLFHEFGHALHHTLSEVEESGCFGISGVPWDAVELPSTLMEFFVMDDTVLPTISGHYKTGDSLPKEMVNSLKAMKTSLSSLTMMRQMEFSLVDMKAHMNKESDIDNLGSDFRFENGVPRLEEGISSYNQFAHIFSGGYAAGYYSYKWANILSSDIFESFEGENINKQEKGREFLKSILSQGGSRDMLDLFTDFKGRAPKSDAFLRHSGIVV